MQKNINLDYIKNLNTPLIIACMCKEVLFVIFITRIFTSGIPCGEKALKGGTTSETFSYPGGGGSNNDVLKI